MFLKYLFYPFPKLQYLHPLHSTIPPVTKWMVLLSNTAATSLVIGFLHHTLIRYSDMSTQSHILCHYSWVIPCHIDQWSPPHHLRFRLNFACSFILVPEKDSKVLAPQLSWLGCWEAESWGNSILIEVNKVFCHYTTKIATHKIYHSQFPVQISKI